MCKPKMLTVPLAKIEDLATLASAIDDAQSMNCDSVVYKKLSLDLHNTIAEMLGPHAVLIYGEEEQIQSINIENINSLAVATLQ